MKIAVINLITRTSLYRHKVPPVQSNRDAMIVKFVTELKSQGADVDLYISDAYKPLNDEALDIKINYLPTCLKWIFWPTRLPFTPSLFRELKNRYDIVICSEAFQWSAVIAVFAGIFSREKKMKIIVWQELGIHQKLLMGWPSRFYHKVILKFFLDRFIACYVPRSRQAGKFLMEQGISVQKISSPIPHGYDQNVFFNDPAVKKEMYIFSPARLVHAKGIDVLLKAFDLVRKKTGHLELLIQGEGPLLEEYKALSQDLRLNGQVRFETDRLNHHQMRERYQKALITVISSRADNVIFSDMESIACGTPVILSTGVDSHTNYLDGTGGRYFQNEDYLQLAARITEIIKNPGLRWQMQKEALQKSDQFKNSTIAKQFLELIQTINPGTTIKKQSIRSGA